MEIRCPSCQARFELDVQLVESGPVRVQCTRCTSVFRVENRAAPPVAWQIRRKGSGELLPFDGLHTLQRWIVERHVTRDDEISRTGEQWKPLGSIAELSSFFAVIDDVEQASGDLELPDVLAGVVAGLDSLGGTEIEVVDRFDAPDDSAQPSAAPTSADDLTQALLASLSVEKPAVRRPITSSISSIVDADSGLTLADIVDQPDPPAAVAVTLEPVEVGGTLVAFPKPGHDDDAAPGAPTLHELPETRPASTPARKAPTPAPAPVMSATSPLDLADELAPTRNPSVWIVAAVVVLVVGAIVVALVSGEDTAATDEAAADESVETRATATAVTDVPATPDDPAPDDSSATADTPAAPGSDETAAATPDEEAAGQPTEAPSTATDDGAPAPTADDTAMADAATDDTPAADTPAADDSTADAPDDDDDGGGGGGGGYGGHLKRADRARSKGDHQTALLQYEAAIGVKRTAEAYAGMGWTYIAMGEPHRATSFFERAIALSASHGDAYIGLGKAYQKLGKKQQALAVYDDYLERFPSGPQATIASGQSRKLRADLEAEAAANAKATGDDAPADDSEASDTSDTTATSDAPPTPPQTTDGDDEKKIIIIKKTP